MEIGVEKVMADSLDHFNRYQPVIRSLEVSIVLEKQLNPAGQILTLNKIPDIVMLLQGNGGSRNPAPIILGCVNGKSAPTRSDFEHMIGRFEREFAA